MITKIFLFQLLLTFLTGSCWIYFTVLAGLRFGSKTGGFIGGLPSTALLSFFFIGFTQSPEIASSDTTVFPVAIAISGLFLVVFAMLARKGFMLALLSAVGFWFFLSSIIVFFRFGNFALNLVIYAVVMLFSYLMLEKFLLIKSVSSDKTGHAEKLPKRIPGITKVEAKETEEGMIVLKFKDSSFSAPFLSKFVSDGTIKMFAYLILLHDPNPHPLLCIEEPENYLHPDLLLELCEEIREYSERGGQVLVSTHSPDFVNGVNIDELHFLTKENGFSRIKAAIDDEQVKELAADNQLGWLWRNHYINGANLK